jgi:methionine-rich copper-binding protein CopC
MCKLAIRFLRSAALVATFVGSAPVVAMAFPSFVSATPTVGSLVTESVQVVRIKISQPLFPGQTFARLADRSEPLKRFPAGHVGKSHPRTIVIHLPHPLSPGRYVVHWQACAFACHVGSEPPISAHYSFVLL